MSRKSSRIVLASGVVLTAAALTATGLSASASASPAPAAAKAAAPVVNTAAPAHKGHGKKGKSQTVTIYLTRHGQTILNTLERVQGWTDSPLVIGTNPDGSKLYAPDLPLTVGKNLRAREGKFDAAYSADMKRHYETAGFVLKGAKQRLAIKQDARLREINFGKYEGAENKEMWSAIVENMGYTVDHDAAPGTPGHWQQVQAQAIADHGMEALMVSMKEIGEQATETGVKIPAEDCSEVSKRMMQSLNSIAKNAVKNHDKRVLVLSSGLSITCAINSLGTTVQGPISNLAVSKLEYSKGTWTVKSVGDTSYRQ